MSIHMSTSLSGHCGSCLGIAPDALDAGDFGPKAQVRHGLREAKRARVKLGYPQRLCMVVFPLNDPAVKEYPEKNRHRHTQRFGQHEFQLPCICSAACIFLQGSGKTLKPFRLSLETFSMVLSSDRHAEFAEPFASETKALEALREGITGRQDLQDWVQNLFFGRVPFLHVV